MNWHAHGMVSELECSVLHALEDGINWSVVLLSMIHGQEFEIILETTVNRLGSTVVLACMHYDEDMGFIKTLTCPRSRHFALGECPCGDDEVSLQHREDGGHADTHDIYEHDPLTLRETFELLLGAPEAYVEWWAM